MDIDVGPVDPSVLYEQELHVSSAVWEAQERGLLRCQEHTSLLHQWKLTDEQTKLVDKAGFGLFRRIGPMTLNNSLISALVERWRRETNTFHLPLGEITITLDEVSLVLGLQIDGDPVVGPKVGDEAAMDMCGRLLGKLPSAANKEVNCSRVKLNWLKRTFSECPEDASSDVVKCHTRAYLLYLIGSTIFATTDGDKVSVKYLPLFEDFDRAGRYAWGAAALACLYRALGNASLKSQSNICGCLTLLQCWSYFHLDIGRPEKSEASFPLALLWKGKGSRSKTDLSEYRRELDDLDPTKMQICWCPYERYENMIPPHVKAKLSLGRSKTTLVCFEKIELHFPDRCLRQFGKRQPIPQKVKRRDRKNRRLDDLDTSMTAACEEWAERGDHIVDSSGGGNVVDDGAYMEWYARISITKLNREAFLENRRHKIVKRERGVMERNSFHYSTEKRSRAVDPGSGFGSSKRAKTHHAQLLSPLVVPVGHASFRLLSPISQVGAVIGKSGSVIKQLQQSTGAKIRVEEPPVGSPDRVITIIAQVDSRSRVKLGVDSNGNTEAERKEEDEVEVSKAQAAVIRVFEILAAEADSSTVVCRLLTESSHAGAVIGKGGQMVGRIRKETGCKIAIRTENLPICADCDDEMVEIEGNVNAVKKALVSVSRCLQDCQDVKKIRTVGNRPLEKETIQESSHRPLETIIQESLLRRSVEDYDYRPRGADMFPRGHLARPSDVIPHDALHHGHIDGVSQGTLRRHIEEDRQDALLWQIEAERHDALRRHIDLGPREVLYRPSDGVRGDVFRQHSEVDTSSHDSLGRPYEMVQRDAVRGMQFESFQRDAFGRTIETIPQETLRRPSGDFLAHRSSTLDTHPHSITTSALMSNAVTLKPHQAEVEAENQDVVFKILCSIENAGGVIGTGGKVIRTLHSESGAFISVGNTIADCEERLITVTAPESPERQSSPAQKAILLVFTRLFELATKKIVDNGSRMSITARLVVPTSQIGCLLGKGGAVVSEMRKATGAAIQILKAEQNPKCISENDQVVQITGEFPNVREAIFHVTSRLRDSLFSKSMKSSVTKSNSTLTTERIHRGQSDNPLSVGSHQSFGHPPTISTSLNRRSDDSFLSGSQLSANYLRPAGTDPYTRPEDPVPDRFNPSGGYSPNFGRRSTMDHNGISHHLTETASRMWASPPPAALRGLSDASGGLSSARPGHVLGSGHKSAIVTNTTVEIRVPENAMSFVYGEHGNNLEQLRQISGARVIVHEPQLGTSDRIIVISGTPDQTQSAQNLLHAFILKGETSLSKRCNLN